MLAVRHKVLDAVILIVLGGSLIFLAGSIPDQPGASDPGTPGILHDAERADSQLGCADSTLGQSRVQMPARRIRSGRAR